MVGLSIVLESDKATTSSSTSTSKNSSKKSAQVLNKVITINNIPTPPASPCSRSSSFCRSSFLDQCFLCKRRLLPCTDIYMYQGDRAFCSEECRCRQIFMDEQNEMKKKKTNTSTTSTKTATPMNSNRREKCSLAAMRSSPTSSPSSRKSK